MVRALSRFDETPDTLMIELTETGYVALGDEADVAAAAARKGLLDVVPPTEAAALDLEGLRAAVDRVVEQSRAEHEDEEGKDEHRRHEQEPGLALRGRGDRRRRGAAGALVAELLDADEQRCWQIQSTGMARYP